jgi:hypothetical protein
LAFLFCAANADVPARAKAKTALIRIRFIIVLREKFLAADSIGMSLILLSSGQVEIIDCKACALSPIDRIELSGARMEVRVFRRMPRIEEYCSCVAVLSVRTKRPQDDLEFYSALLFKLMPKRSAIR